MQAVDTNVLVRMLARDDVKQAALMVAANYYRDRQRDMGIQSESLGGYSYSRRSTDETRAAMADILSGWRTIR